MDFNDTADEASFRTEVRAWLQSHAVRKINGVSLKQALDEAGQLAAARAWQQKIATAGWACLTWPKQYGGAGLTPMHHVIWKQEVAAYDEMDGFFTIGEGMCGAALMAFATEEQKQHYLPRLAAAQDIWCQLFSEPSAGSDVAGVKTRAERKGDNWIVNGQKVWTSGAHFCDYGILLCRTDPTLPKHKGMTFFFVNLKQPGVDIRPIKQADGGEHFNEVFFNDAVIPDAQRLGEINGGWKGALTVMMAERLTIGGVAPTGFPEFLSLCRELSLDGVSAIDHPVVRDRLANWYVREAGLKHIHSRTLSALSRGGFPGPESSLGKLVGAPMNQDINIYAMELMGEAGVVVDPQFAPHKAHFQKQALFAPGIRLAGGTDEVMRNIIAEQVLGMPADIKVDKDMPFNQVRSGSQT